MSTEYSGSGDPQRTIELLWGSQQRPKRGPKPRLTVEQIARTALEVADAEGLAALSMRRVADELGVATMSLYTYVPSKAELIDVMLDTVYGETARPEEVAGGWRARLEQIARENWALYHRHPWMLQIATSRPVMGPNLIAKYDYELRAVSGIGLTEVEMDSVVSLVAGHVEGAARRAVEAAQAEQHTGMTDEQWWAVHAPLLEKVLDASRYPTAARVGAAAGATYGAAHDPQHAFEFGLQRVLDGIEVLIQARAERPGPSGP
ncbi:TetR/AcrR family transcriptional regulator [Vitiosangium sp. GDMCC 1.1324]|uniref:TetR/AcrR family transcriptional regulator n=1 Tax=Vitiosangium sp. (strain GDMCC 1.1324) TaxID=2138576 RepID=UPI000D3B7518|nr:TetR/AcrR family transcriptional regulator [Vitiosangium sp. GDMCC 1.1324]PTL79877.1 TetR/AcrR family transcriptional regulator [Vitiosangium sp. GDMCC 1.1324]